jgi:myo-inositol 2-dehydrogenase / D-chiro-inositol 1-dehydrogenase
MKLSRRFGSLETGYAQFGMCWRLKMKRNGVMNPKIPIALGVIGCGKAANLLHLAALERLPQYHVVAAADTHSSRLEYVSRRFGIPNCFDDYRALLNSKEVEAVLVLTPTQSHAEIGSAAIDAGKHVLMEKPLALTLEECDRLIEKAKVSSGKVMVGFNFRWHRLIVAAKKIVESGKLGKLKAIRSVYTHWHPGETAQDWHKYRELGGGVLFNDGVHHFDLWRFLIGSEVVKIYSQCLSSKYYEDDTATVIATMANGVLASGVFSFETAPNSEIEVFGEKGRLYLNCYRFDGLEFYPYSRYPGKISDRVKKISLTLKALAKAVPLMRHGGDFNATYRVQLKHFADCINENKAPQCTLEDGRRAIQIALGALNSLSIDRAVEMK